MEDMQAARDLAAKILDTNSVPVYSEEGIEKLLDDVAGDSVPSTSPEAEVPDFVPVSDPDFVPVPDLKPRKKRKTEVENLEIDLKGWNSISLSPMIQSLVSDSLPPHKDEDVADSKKEQLSSEQSVNDFYPDFNETDSFNDCIILV